MPNSNLEKRLRALDRRSVTDQCPSVTSDSAGTNLKYLHVLVRPLRAIATALVQTQTLAAGRQVSGPVLAPGPGKLEFLPVPKSRRRAVTASWGPARGHGRLRAEGLGAPADDVRRHRQPE